MSSPRVFVSPTRLGKALIEALNIPPSLPIKEANLVVNGAQTCVRVDIMLTPELARAAATALTDAATEAETRLLRANAGDDGHRH